MTVLWCGNAVVLGVDYCVLWCGNAVVVGVDYFVTANMLEIV